MNAIKKMISTIMTAAILAVTGCGGTADKTAETSSETAEQTSVQTTASSAEAKEETTVTRPERPTFTKDDKVIALTFDDGPNLTTTTAVINKLEEYNIVASFFLVGDNITGNENEGSAKVAKRAYDMGCEINSHSKTHSNMTEMSPEDIKAEMDYTSDKIFEITGERPHFFRPPYIAVNDVMFESIDLPFIAGYGANDWEDSVSADERAEKVLAQAKDGAIILLHDMQGNSKTVEALDTIIPALKDEGYNFVTVSELFAAKGVEPQDNIVYSFAEQTTMYG